MADVTGITIILDVVQGGRKMGEVTGHMEMEGVVDAEGAFEKR